MKQEEFIEKAILVHGEEYDYSKVEYKNTNTKVCIICPKHGEFFQKPSKHLLGQGCPKCRYKKVSNSLRRNLESVIEKCQEVHGDEYDYSLIKEYNNDREKLPIICEKHGVFFQTMNNHIIGKQGCPKCGFEKSIDSKRLTFDKFKQRASEKHNGEYEYIECNMPDGNETKVGIVCKKHGIFYQKASNHLFGQGCPKCATERVHEKQKDTTETFIKKAMLVHGNRYGYDKVEYINTKEKVCITCHEHGDFFQEPGNHLQGNGCPLCVDYSSCVENEIRDFICSEYNGPVKNNVRGILDGFREIDIYLPDLKIGFEINGIFWHSEANNADRKYHLKKTEECAEKGIRLIHIFEDEWTDNTKREIMKSMIRNILQVTPRRIFARRCSVLEVEPKTARDFLKKNHIQGACGSNTKLGLFYEGELVSLMCFGKTRHFIGNSRCDTELLRFCNLINLNVVGGASKLFKHYVKEHPDESIVSYADRRWSTGNLYDKLGFKLYNKSKPNYFYVVGRKRKNRFSFRKSELVRRYNCPKELSEKEFCQQQGWFRIYDCGCLCYEWKEKK